MIKFSNDFIGNEMKWWHDYIQAQIIPIQNPKILKQFVNLRSEAFTVHMMHILGSVTKSYRFACT